MELKEQWRSNLRAMQLRVKDRLRIASSPRLSLLRHLHRSGKAAAAAYANKAFVVGGAKPLNAMLSTVLVRQLTASTSFARRFVSDPKIEEGSASPNMIDISSPTVTTRRAPQTKASDSSYTAVFSENSYAVRLLQAVALPVIGNVCHVFMHSFNKTEVYGADKLLDAVTKRPQGQPLITVSNHVASMDDPLVLAAILPPHILFHADSLRWTMCATDRCFTSKATSAFFRCVKVLPLARGAGVHQKGIDMAVERLKGGDWIHIFPEGSRSRDGGKTIQSAKRGIGRLVVDSGQEPLVIPFVHSGMQEVMPIGSKFPSVRKKVVVLVGDPIKLGDLLSDFQDSGIPETMMYDAIAFRVSQHLKELKARLDDIVLNQNNGDLVQGSFESSLSEWITDNSEQQVAVDNYKKHKHADYLPDVRFMSDEFRLRLSTNTLEESMYSDRTLVCVNKNSFYQEGVISRLQKFKDPAALLGFAAQGLFRYTHEIQLKDNYCF